MALILNIETTTTNCSVCIAKEGVVITQKSLNNKNYSHSESLHVFIEELISKSQITMQDLDAIAVSEGPGSYTGLRIGVSAAKGLCYALDIPLIAVPTLDVLSRQVKIEEGYIVSMLDARRMEVYAAVYDKVYNTIEVTNAKIIDENSFADLLQKHKLYFNGNAVDKVKAVLQHENAVFFETSFPSANEMAKLSYEKYKKSDTEDVAYFEPFYLKEFIALKSSK